MSKLDAQRAMREARYAARNSTGAPTRREAAAAAAPTTPTDAAATSQTPPRTPAVKPARTKTSPVAATSGELCGHTSISGRTCTREAGHPQKSHRYG